MKKSILLFLCVLGIGLSSCKKETIVPANRTILVDINPNNWRTDNGYDYYNVITVGENNTNFNQNGTILVTMSFTDANTYVGLPVIFNNLDYSYTSSPGIVTIYARSISNAVVKPTTLVTAKITLIDAVGIQ